VLDGIVDSVDYPTVAAGEIVPLNPLFPELIIPEPQRITNRELGERIIVTALIALAIYIYIRMKGKGETLPAVEGGKNEKLEPFTEFENKQPKKS
jgi:hypothetical protein